MIDLDQKETLEELLFRVDGVYTESESSDSSEIDSKVEEEI
ncbi:hypothetical protein [Dysgonomonas sp. GY75]|nr:hypothetical protein [Dysgonomonas sp. GY75]